MSNATEEFAAFKRAADRDPAKNPSLTIVDGAQDGWDAERVKADPKYWTTSRPAWRRLVSRRTRCRLSAEGARSRARTAASREMRRRCKQTCGRSSAPCGRYTSLRLVYLSSRTYGGYAVTGLNPEPAAYDSGYGCVA